MSERHDHRYWIVNPTGHRMAWQREMEGRDGEIVDSVFGEAVLIVPPMRDADDWVCDLCNETILTRWGAEPFPVPMLSSSSALCAEHYEEVKTWNYEDPESGEEWPFPMGEWPAHVCSCMPCQWQIQEWLPQMSKAFAELAG